MADHNNHSEILSTAEMIEAEQLAMDQGISGFELMATAGGAVADAVMALGEPVDVVVLAGPGNNGGDGFVAARRLSEAGWDVRLYLLGEVDKLKGDAATAAAEWDGDILSLADTKPGGVLKGAGVVVDALFGAGLARPLDGAAKAMAQAVGRARAEGRLQVVAVDMPSGVHGDSGQTLGGVSFQADVTVTFCRFKPGHLLLPGRDACGRVEIADIGISDAVISKVGPKAFLNTPDLWPDAIRPPGLSDHKYNRGHLVVLGGARMTGAARLAAQGARRTGAGLVTIAAPDQAFAIYAAGTPGTLVSAMTQSDDFGDLLADPRKNACVLGPGAGVCQATRDAVLTALGLGKACVIDADAISVFQSDAKALFKAIGAKGAGPVVLTPHEGEFRRLFYDVMDEGAGKISRTREAARRSGAVVLFKGADTVIAAPDGRVSVNAHAPSTLATAGSGDVLAGMIGALLSQGAEPFQAASAAVWMHGEAALKFGPGLIAEDLPEMLPQVLANLFGASH